VVRRAGTQVPLVAVLGGTTANGRQVKITTMAGSFAFPLFYISRSATIGTGLFASSTLSLGLPLAGLSGGRDRVGRHYVCDVSFSKEIFARAGVAWTPLFAEQPVVQIFPVDS
jgi:hypothetical protein